ncbi:unnamed protein product, partial [Mesorhabditis belari]|uniref:Uncharacterized protein n=1 Tax=Mesorhabditis belari TaxID=2138241 RepID=A0AAF3FCY6_9BILA
MRWNNLQGQQQRVYASQNAKQPLSGLESEPEMSCLYQGRIKGHHYRLYDSSIADAGGSTFVITHGPWVEVTLYSKERNTISFDIEP